MKVNYHINNAYNQVFRIQFDNWPFFLLLFLLSTRDGHVILLHQISIQQKDKPKLFQTFQAIKEPKHYIVACKYKYLVSFGTWRDENDRGHSFDQQHRTLYTTVKQGAINEGPRILCLCFPLKKVRYSCSHYVLMSLINFELYH